MEPKSTENDLSGRVTGPVVQAGIVHGDVNITGAADSPVMGFTSEELAEELRRSARTWRLRFASVDFVNLPRVAMLSAGEPVMEVARRAQLNVAKPFQGQGMAPGSFVAMVRPLFETWDAEAVVLDSSTVGQVHQGMLVSFESSMRCINPPAARPDAPSGDLATDPYLTFQAGDYRVIVSFDPQWLTTVTAGVTLHDAARHRQPYSGLGRVAAVFADGRIRVSALVFGQPQTANQAVWEYTVSSTLSMPRELVVADFRNELSSGEGVPAHAYDTQKERTVERLGVVLFFDENRVMPGDIDRAVLAQAVRVVPEYRRDLGMAIASLVPPRGVGVDDIAAHLLAREPALWKTFTVPGLASLVQSRPVAVAVVTGVTREQAVDLDAAMREEVAAYLGAVELDRSLVMHHLLFPKVDRYHVVEAELRLRYSAGDRALADADGEDFDEPLEEWRAEGLVGSVVWEEDEEQSAADNRQAMMIMEMGLRDQAGH